MYLNSFDKFLQDPNISMNPLNIVAAFNKNAVLPLAIFYRNHGYNTFILLDNTEESKQISSQLASNEFNPIQTIFFEKDGKTIESIEDYIIFMQLTKPTKLNLDMKDILISPPRTLFLRKRKAY
jgi:hypothetical protein